MHGEGRGGLVHATPVSRSISDAERDTARVLIGLTSPRTGSVLARCLAFGGHQPKSKTVCFPVASQHGRFNTIRVEVHEVF